MHSLLPLDPCTTPCPLADHARADIAAATSAAAAKEENDTDNDGRPASLSGVRARTPARHGS